MTPVCLNKTPVFSIFKTNWNRKTEGTVVGGTPIIGSKTPQKGVTKPVVYSIQSEYASHSGWILTQFAPKKEAIQAELRVNSAWIARENAMIIADRKCKPLIFSHIPTMLKMAVFPTEWRVGDEESKLRHSCYLDKGPRNEEKRLFFCLCLEIILYLCPILYMKHFWIWFSR